MTLVPLLVGCGDPFPFEDLYPYVNGFGPGEAQWAPQPHRDNPQEVVRDASGQLWVSLPGAVDLPGHEVAVVDPDNGDVLRVDVDGSSPTGLALHPSGRHLVVFLRYSNRAAIVDVEKRKTVDHVPMDFYAIEGAFSPDGRELWVTNRWKDEVQVFAVVVAGDELTIEGPIARVPVAANPRDVKISDDGRTVAVASLTSVSVTLIDRETRHELARHRQGAAIDDVAWVGDHVVLATVSGSTHHLPDAGPDGDADGHPGDGTPNTNFQDMQNELVVLDGRTGAVAWVYTSDTICCKDFRDVDPDNLAQRGDLLPPRDTWIVEGALPEQLAVTTSEDGVSTLAVTYSASNQVQTFDVQADGSLVAGTTFETVGHNPHGIVWDEDRLVVAHRLGETLGVYDATSGAALVVHEVGDRSGGEFPATDAEIGELVNFVTAPFTVDGDQSCTHCHREGGNIDKALSMPLALYPGIMSRMTQAYRGAFDSRPWFFESSMDETNFKPVLNEFARVENFCCTDFSLLPEPPGDCESAPPAECTTELAAGSPDTFGVGDRTDKTLIHHEWPTEFVTRDLFYLDRIQMMTGRTESFGDGVYYEDPITLDRTPTSLNFEGITQALGLFLLNEPMLLPNPNDPDSQAATRGEAIFGRSDVGCITCHPPPAFAAGLYANPFEVPLRMGPVVSAQRSEDGINLDLLSSGFMDTFPLSTMDTCEDVCGDWCEDDGAVCDDVRNVYFGPTTLRGIWDRVGAAMLHDGRARSLREVLATPGHPALQPGEIGFNERDGVPDTHGGTSHLSAAELADLEAYLLTL